MGPHALKTREFVSCLLYVTTFEFVLRKHANGGAVIVSRAAPIAVLTFFGALCIKNWLAPAVSASPRVLPVDAELADNIEWLGAIFAGVYVAFYTRFAAQWEYIAGPYNQIKAIECQDHEASRLG
jgi:hypothetical protein